MFGSCGHRESPAGLVIENYLHRGAADFSPNRHVKSIIRPELMTSAIHSHAFHMDGSYVDLAGRPVIWHEPGILAETPDYAGGKLHHYFTRSWDDWLAKLRRGDPSRTRAVDEFYVYDRNEIFDAAAAHLAPAVRAILSALGAGPKYWYSIVACARWEAPYIVEWVNYHRLIGFDHIFLYCNDDDPLEMFELLLPFTEGEHRFVTFQHFLYQGQQQAMYEHFLKNHKDKTEWVAFLDIDEFLRLPRDGTVDRFVKSFGGATDAIYLNWLFFGNSGFQTPPPGGVLKNYTMRETNVSNMMTKTFAKSSIFPSTLPRGEFAGHIWHYLNCLENFAAIRIQNVLGRDMQNYYFGEGDRETNDYLRSPGIGAQILSVAMINHYAYRSSEALQRRLARGTLGEFGNQSRLGSIGYVESLNQVEDTALATLWSSVLDRAYESCVTPMPAGRLISLHKPASQSSVSAWSRRLRVEEDAAGAVDGQIGRDCRFHTAAEDAPWWMVDLLDVYALTEIRLFNRMDLPERAARLKIEVCAPVTGWVEVFRKEDATPFGGADGYPLICRISPPMAGRFVRVTLLGRNFLHLNQVQVFGEIDVGKLPAPGGTEISVP